MTDIAAIVAAAATSRGIGSNGGLVRDCFVLIVSRPLFDLLRDERSPSQYVLCKCVNGW
jgi:hypothetical protein